MNVFKESSPLLIPTLNFSSFEEYINSLSKSSRYDLNKKLENNSHLDYSQVLFNYEECKKFMDVWEECNNWNWGDWYSEKELNILYDKGILKCFKSGDSAYHFVLKFGRYVYCNAPLYDKRLHKQNELGKWMWLQLIKFSIENKWVDYIDLMGPPGLKTFGEVLENRQYANENGDFRNKWKFIPKEIKDRSNKSYDNLEIHSDFRFYWKNIFTYKPPSKLLIVAHYDDEAIFFGNWLHENGPDTKVVCMTHAGFRFHHFQKCMELAGVFDYSYLDLEAVLAPLHDESELKRQEIINFLKSIRDEHNWDRIVTHNIYGEYGHIQHVETHEMVKEVFDNDKIYVYYNSLNKKGRSLKQKFLDCYETEQLAVHEIGNSIHDGSDWYKHTIGKNMIDYESLKKLSELKSKLNLVFYCTLPENNFRLNFVNDLKDLLRKNGHIISMCNDLEFAKKKWSTDAFVVFSEQDARNCIELNKKYFYFVDEENVLNYDYFDQFTDSIDLSIKSFTTTHPTRTFFYNTEIFNNRHREKLCRREKIFWMPTQRSSYILSKKLEAHLWMGLVGENII